MTTVQSTLKRTFYVTYSYHDKLGRQHIGASDVSLYGTLNADAVKKMQAVLAEKVDVDLERLLITFFAELER